MQSTLLANWFKGFLKGVGLGLKESLLGICGWMDGIGWDGMGWDGMVIIGHRSSKSIFSAYKCDWLIEQ